ncbi:MAG: RNA polymerase sigma factor [Planctomycetota bacterium]|jgi:RNA polymerase sigma-70 factor (ECF subfamily)
MLEDKLLVWRFKRGGASALCRIYEKYRDPLLRLAVSLSNRPSVAEDIVHDVFTSFIRNADRFELTGSLKSYLATCVVNRVRNVNRDYRRRTVALTGMPSRILDDDRPDKWIICSEQLRRLTNALAQLPDNQREAITLHLQGRMKFREIAEFQNVPTKTAQSRYHNGLEKLRLQLNGEVAK